MDYKKKTTRGRHRKETGVGTGRTLGFNRMDDTRLHPESGKNRLGQATPLAGPPRSTSEKLKQNKRNGGGQPTRERRTQNYASNQPLTKKANKTQLSRPRGWAHAEPAAAVAKTRGQPRLVTFSKNDSRWKNRGAQRGHKNSTERPEDSLPIGPRPLVSWTGGRIVSQQIHL